MKLIINYLENNLEITDSEMYVLEIENKSYFYRLVNDLHNICDGNIVDNISLFDSDNNEINYLNKFKMVIDFFDFEFNSKKISTDIIKYISKNISTELKDSVLNQYNKIIKLYRKELNNINIPLKIEQETDVDSITKNIKVSVEMQKNLIDNLFLLIDIENILKNNRILIFVNLKQYLEKNEIEELYKYSIYNGVSLLLIDSQCYGCTLNHEKKLIIDENLDEFVI